MSMHEESWTHFYWCLSFTQSSTYMIRGLLLPNVQTFGNIWSLELTVQGFVKYSAYEKLPPIHRSHRAALKHRAIVGIHGAYHGLLRQSVLDAKCLSRKNIHQQYKNKQLSETFSFPNTPGLVQFSEISKLKSVHLQSFCKRASSPFLLLYINNDLVFKTVTRVSLFWEASFSALTCSLNFMILL